MKKLMLIALVVLGATAFAAEDNTNTSNGTTTTTTSTTVAATPTAPTSIGDSFMAAFGMAGNGTSASTSEGNVTTGVETGSAAVVGVVSAAANAATTIANNSTTIVTPYGKY